MWYPPDFRVLYDLKVLPIFDHAHSIIIKLTLAFLNLYQNAQKLAHFINSLSWDIADFRVSWSKRPLAFLTTTTQKKTFQPDLLRNRDKKPKVMSNNAAQHGWAARKKFKYNMCSDDLTQPFPNFLFSMTAIFYFIFFQKLKQKYNLVIFISIDKLWYNTSRI